MGFGSPVGGKLRQLDFGLATNLDVRLPYQGVIPAFVCAGTSQVFVATAGAGSIQYNKTTRKCRQWMEKDGLYSDAVRCLCLQGDTLWIGYGSEWRGGGAGIGRMDLPTGRLTAFTPSVSSSLAGRDPSTQAPRNIVLPMAAGPDGDMFVSSRNKGVQRYHAREDRWDMVTNSAPRMRGLQRNGPVSSPMATSTMDGWVEETVQTLRMQTLSDGHWEGFGKEAAIPIPTASAIALDGQDIWLGGRGFIGVINPAQKTMRKFCYTQVAEGLSHGGRGRVGLGSVAWFPFPHPAFRRPVIARIAALTNGLLTVQIFEEHFLPGKTNLGGGGVFVGGGAVAQRGDHGGGESFLVQFRSNKRTCARSRALTSAALRPSRAAASPAASSCPFTLTRPWATCSQAWRAAASSCSDFLSRLQLRQPKIGILVDRNRTIASRLLMSPGANLFGSALANDFST